MGTYVIDTGRTFSAILLAASQPKTKFGTVDQDRTAAGVPKWQVAATVIFSTDDSITATAAPEVINVTIASTADPAAGIAPGTPVTFEAFRVGWSVPEARDGGRVRGGRPW